MTDLDLVVSALGRGGRRAIIHLLKAAIEGVKAVESVLDELGKMDQGDEGEPSDPGQRIEVE